MHRVLITGAAGRIGAVLREGLRGRFDRLRLTDRRELSLAAGGEELVRLDLADLDGVVEAMDGVDGVVHLAAVPTEDAFELLLPNNLLATYNVFEAARLRGVRRVVFASTNHVTGFHPRSRRVGPDDPVRPDTLYGVTKVFGEALGRLYADKFGLEVICLRIGAFSQHPPSARGELNIWLSHRDAVQLTIKALTAEAIDFLIVYGVSGNCDSWYDNPGAERLGYEPQDIAPKAAPEPAPRPAGRPKRRSETLQGGEYTNQDFGRRERR